MGVMKCNREKCKHIMCDRLITGAGGIEYYICDECAEELRNFLHKKYPEGEIEKGELLDAVDEFMRTECGRYDPEKGDVDEMFDKILTRGED